MEALAALARIVRAIGGLIAAVLVLGTLLVAFEANEDNALVDAILEVGRFFADPFRAIFELDNDKVQIAINWGIAAAVYLLVAGLVAMVLRRGARPTRRA